MEAESRNPATKAISPKPETLDPEVSIPPSNEEFTKKPSYP